MQENNQEDTAKYTKEDFTSDLEKSGNNISIFLNNICLNLPLDEGKGALYRDVYLGRAGWDKSQNISTRTLELFNVVDVFCSEKGVDFAGLTSFDILQTKKDFLTELYIHLRGMGFDHQEIIA